ncbi:hypothetical protein LTR37_017265 [Vermiconidia calcicola]|uniref:Uncharacterized protein n=1 Tax=Vermiconidia calcicola TaxID=1690605 RepID=A0ACC3MLE3_9PEZI|nr:hypothetical protein LTR37_017265 [Vermiconidia calcicola]
MASATAPTKSVYQYDETLREHLTRLTDIRRFNDVSPEEQALFKAGSEHTYVVDTAETIFYAQGGGQPFDTGYISAKDAGEKEKTFHVYAVRYGKEGRVLHFGHFPDNSSPFEAGDMIEQHIDDARRDMNSRIHTAGHVLGLAVRRLAEKTSELDVSELKASHYPDAAFVEFKGIIDSKYKDAIQSGCSQSVADALPVKLYWYKPEELNENDVITVEGMPIVAGADGKVRVVDIVGAGAYPCGGTHVPDTGFIGSMTVKSIKRQKGISKISYSISERGGN